MSDDRLEINFGDLSPECQQIIKDIFDKLEQIESILNDDNKVSFKTSCTQSIVYQGWIKDMDKLSLSTKKADSLVNQQWKPENIKTYLTGFLYFFLIVSNAFLYLFIL